MTSLLEALKRIEARGVSVAPAAGPGEAAGPTEAATAARRPEPAAVEPEDSEALGEPADWTEEAGGPGRDLRDLLGEPGEGHDRPYRDLATNILSQLVPGRARVVLFTGPPGVLGQSSAVARLAAAVADAVPGEVLAADANFRHPGLAEQFGVEAERGLADVLLGAAAWQKVVRPTGIRGLGVLPGRRFPTPGPRPPDRFRPAWLLDELRQRYRLVLLDAGSLGHEEVVPWIRFCDGTYLVLGLGQTTARAARRAVQMIDRHRGLALGCILT